MKVTSPATFQSPDTQKWVRRGRALEYFTLAWNVIEPPWPSVRESPPGAPPLWGFGLDSLIESLSGLVLVWRLGGRRLDTWAAGPSSPIRVRRTSVRIYRPSCWRGWCSTRPSAGGGQTRSARW